MIADKQQLTIQQAYVSMIKFLEDYYERTKSDDIGSLLGDLQLDENNMPFDPAAYSDWLNAINKACQD